MEGLELPFVIREATSRRRSSRTRELTARAIAFSERWGFERVGEAPFPFGRETHRDLLYALRLTGVSAACAAETPNP